MSVADTRRRRELDRKSPSDGLAISHRLFWRAIVILTLLGLGVRFGYIEIVDLQIRTISDAGGYYHMGRYLAEGYGYIRYADLLHSGKVIPTAAYPPLFSFLLSLLHRIGITSLETQHLVVAMAGAVNIPLIALLGRAFRGSATGLVAGVMAALSPALLEIDGSFMSEAAFVPIVTSALVVTVRASDQKQARDWILAGALLGFAALARPEALLLLPALAFPILWVRGGERRTVLALGLIAACGIVVLPWTIRNAVRTGAFVPVSQNYKGAIRGANCPVTYNHPEFVGGWFYGCVADSLGAGGAGSTEAERFDRARALGVKYAMDHRKELPRVLAARLIRTWGLHRPGKWREHRRAEVRNVEFSSRTWYYGWILLALMPVGLALLASRSIPHLWIALCPILVVSATTLVGYGNPRFRAAAEPSLIILAAVSLTARAGGTTKRGRGDTEPTADL